MSQVRVHPHDLVNFTLDPTQLSGNIVPVDQGLRLALPKKLKVALITLVNPTHDIAIEAAYHRKDGFLYSPGLRMFFRKILGQDMQSRRSDLYIGRSFDVTDTYVVVTRDEVAETLGIHPRRVDVFIALSSASRRRPLMSEQPTRRGASPTVSRAAARSGDAGSALASVPAPALASARAPAARPRSRPGAGASAGPVRVQPVPFSAHTRAQAPPLASGPASASASAPGPARSRVSAGTALAEKLETEARAIIRSQLLAIPEDITIPVDTGSMDMVLTKLDAGRFDTVESAQAHEQALVLSTSPGFDTLISLDVVRNIVPFAYQVGAVREVLRKMRGRAILADEVGLGKTIEAGLVMTEYILRGLAKRVLILCPPPLMSQWMDEMRSKFNMDFVASDDSAFVERKNPWLEVDRIIASIDTAKRAPHAELVQAAPFDLVIVDEAHRCRNNNTLAWKLVNGLRKKYILLLTATPVQNDLRELFNLITLLRPGQLETASDFSRRFITRGDRLKPRNVADLRDLMKEVMVRNRRATCGLELPRRRAETVRVSLSPEESRFYSEVTEFVRKQYGTGGGKGATRLALKTLQKEAGSSAFAVVPTVERMLSSGYFAGARRDLKALADAGRAVEDSAKAQALLKLFRATDDKVLVFTGYTATLDFLARYLKEAGISYATFSGEMGRLDKERAVGAFRKDARVLLSTESGGEGRNLQFCHVMVNFDLPWNPMRIEQRIGRIHRIGQENDVLVFNLSASGTLEAHILDLLDAKINMFELVVGELDMILGNIEEEEDFEDTIMDLWAGSTTEEDLKDRLENLGAQLVQARARYEGVKEYDDNLFGSELSSGKDGADGAD